MKTENFILIVIQNRLHCLKELVLVNRASLSFDIEILIKRFGGAVRFVFVDVFDLVSNNLSHECSKFYIPSGIEFPYRKNNSTLYY